MPIVPGHRLQAPLVDRLHRDLGHFGTLDQFAHAAIAPRCLDVQRLHALRMVPKAGNDCMKANEMARGFQEHKSGRSTIGRSMTCLAGARAVRYNADRTKAGARI
jgi:hypothetical protein